MIEDFIEANKKNNFKYLGIVEYVCNKNYIIINDMKNLHEYLVFSDNPIISNYLIFSRKDGSMKHFIDLKYSFENDYLYILKNIKGKNIKIIIFDFKNFDHHLFFVSGYLFY